MGCKPKTSKVRGASVGPGWVSSKTRPWALSWHKGWLPWCKTPPGGQSWVGISCVWWCLAVLRARPQVPKLRLWTLDLEARPALSHPVETGEALTDLTQALCFPSEVGVTHSPLSWTWQWLGRGWGMELLWSQTPQHPLELKVGASLDSAGLLLCSDGLLSCPRAIKFP